MQICKQTDGQGDKETTNRDSLDKNFNYQKIKKV